MSADWLEDQYGSKLLSLTHIQTDTIWGTHDCKYTTIGMSASKCQEVWEYHRYYPATGTTTWTHCTQNVDNVFGKISVEGHLLLVNFQIF